MLSVIYLCIPRLVTRLSILTDNDSSWFCVSYSHCVTVSRGAIWIGTANVDDLDHNPKLESHRVMGRRDPH